MKLFYFEEVNTFEGRGSFIESTIQINMDE